MSRCWIALRSSIAAMVALAAVSPLAAPAAAAERPNIVLILADDLGYGDVGFNGCRDIPTPNLDRLAALGVRFANGYSSHPFCSPMRAGLMTARYQHRFGYVTNVAYDPHNTRMGLPTSQTTIAQRLRQAGYRTGMVGKWHLGAAAPFHPLNRGFDFFFGFLGGGHDYFTDDTTAQLHENYNAALDDNGQPAGLEGYLTDVLTDQALRFLEGVPADQPYFLYMAYNAPHTPMQAPQEWLDKFASITDTKRRTYAAMVAALDAQIGRILAAIDARGEGNQTLVIFTSDNGGPEQANASDNGPLRGQKGEVYEGGIHVPFVMRWSGTLPAGKVFDAPVISIDLSRTALEVAQAEITAEVEGVNLVPHVTGQITSPPHAALFWRMEAYTQTAVRRGNHKLCVVDGQNQLYDLKGDLGEASDLASGQPEIVAELKQLFDLWQRDNQPALFPSFRDYHQHLQAFHAQLEADAQAADSR